MPEGTPMIILGDTKLLLLWTFVMKYFSISPVASKSAITPSFMGLIGTMLAGVLPSILFASAPTATGFLSSLLITTTEGSLHTIPFPLTNTRVFAVPRSIARSFENNPRNLWKNIIPPILSEVLLSQQFLQSHHQIASRPCSPTK